MNLSLVHQAQLWHPSFLWFMGLEDGGLVSTGSCAKKYPQGVCK